MNYFHNELSDPTLSYYQDNSDKFFQSTIQANMTDLYPHFLSRIPEGGSVLDFGCGSGRDSLFFKKAGYKVTALDGSEKLAEKAGKLLNQKVLITDFRDYRASEKYDGIWACASLLHLKEEDLVSVLNELINSLNENGVLYLSFKYGDFDGLRNGRYFHDWTEDNFQKFLNSRIGNLQIDDKWITTDVRPNKSGKWLNLILSKNE